MSKQVDLEILNYDTEYLDAIDGHVTDIVPTTGPKAYPNHTQNVPSNLVLPSQQAGPNPMAGALAHLMAPQQSNGQQDAYAIQHMQAMSEKSTPIDRNRAKLILTAGWVAFVYGVYKSNADENAHSPAGVERHKTDVYGRIRITEIKAADKANERNHETFNRVLDQVYGGGDRVQNRIARKR